MTDFINISPTGTIRVLDVPLCTSYSTAKEIIEKQGYSIIRAFEDRWLNVKISWKLHNLPNIPQVFFDFNGRISNGKNDEVRTLDRIHFSFGGSNKSRDKYFNYFKKLFCNFYIEEETEEILVLFNTLYHIEIKNKYNEKNYSYVLSVSIKAKYGDDSISKFEYNNIRKEYQRAKDEEFQLLGNYKLTKTINKNIIRYVIKTIITICVLVLAYLFVLNDRYYIIDKGHRYFDKWTKTTYIMGSKGNYYPMHKE